MSDRSHPIVAKIERAEKHIRDLDIEIVTFLKTNPYPTIGYDNLKTDERVIELRIVGEPPPSLLTTLGDAIHCLRSSLDYLACQLVMANGRRIDSNTAFPIVYSADKLETEIIGKIDRASEQAKDLVRHLEPYKGGRGDAIWRLHKLDIIDKHRFLITTAIYTGKIALQGVIPSFFSAPLFARGYPPWGALKDGDILLTITREERTPEYKDPEFTFQIAFGEIFKGHPLLIQLKYLVYLVNGILKAFRPLLM